MLLFAAEELSELKAAVQGVREALADLRSNVEPSRSTVLKVNVRDARDSLRRRINQLSPETSSIQVWCKLNILLLFAAPSMTCLLHCLKPLVGLF